MNISGGAVVWILDAETGEFRKALLSAEDQVKKTAETIDNSLNRSSRSSVNALSDLGRSVANVGWGVFTTGAGLASVALTSLITSGIRTADYIETTKIAMSGLTGSVEEGNKALLIAKNFWENNPFNRLDVVPAVKSLIQFGRTTQQVGADLELLGNISLSTKTPIQELALYFARTAGAGRAMTQDLEIMNQRGVPIYKKLQEAISSSDSVFAKQIRNQYGLAKGAEVSSGAVREMASDGVISFGIFEEAMRNAVDPKAMEEFEKTLTRQIERFRGAISILAGEMGGYKITATELIVEQDGLTRSATRLVEAFATGLKTPEMRESINKLGKALVPFVDKITALVPLLLDKLGGALNFISNNTETLIPILGGALVMFGQLGSGIPGVGQVLANLSGVVNGLGGSIMNLVKVNPLLAAFIAFFAVGLVQAYRTNQDFRDSVKKLFTALTELGKKLIPIMTNLVSRFADLAASDGVTNLLIAFVDVLTIFVNVLNRIPDDVLSALIMGILAFKTLSPVLGIIGNLSSGIGGITGILGKFGKGGAEAGGKLVGSTIAGILKPLGSSEVLKGAASAALIGVALITVSMGLSKASAVNINLKNLGTVVAAIAIFSGLSALLGKISTQIVPGLITVIAIAGTLALVGKAIKSVSDNIPSSIGDFAKKMANVGIAIGAMSVLAGVLGLLVSTGVGGAVLAAGLLALVAISAGMVVIAKSIQEVNSKVPSNTVEFTAKIKVIADTIKEIVKLDLGGILKNLGTAINVAIIATTIRKYIQIADYLRAIEKIELNKEPIIAKMKLLKEVIELVGASDDSSIGGQIASVAKNFIKVIDVSIISKVVDVYFDIARKLMVIQDLSLRPEVITKNMNLLKDVVGLVAYSGEGSVLSTMKNAAKQFFDEKATKSAGRVVQVYTDIIGSVKEIEKLEMNPNQVIKNVKDLSSVLTTVMGIDGGGGLFQTVGSFFKGSPIDEKDVGIIQSILNKFTEIARTVNGMVSVGGNSIQKIEQISDVIYALGSINEVKSIGNKEYIVGMSTSILYKMVEIGSVLKNLPNIDNSKIKAIQLIQDAIYHIGQINQVDDIAKKEFIVGQSQSILYKMVEIGGVLKNLPTIDAESAKKVENIRHVIYELGEINLSDDIAKKEFLVGQSQSILYKMVEIGNTLKLLPTIDTDAQAKVETIRRLIYEVGLINQVDDIANREFIVGQSQSILYKMIEFSRTIEGIVDPGADGLKKIENVRRLIYEVGQVNQVDDIANKEFIVGQSQSILYKMVEFSGVLNAMPALKTDWFVAISNARRAIYEVGLINETANIANKEFIVGQTISILYKLNEAAGVIGRLPIINNDQVNNLRFIRHAIYEVAQINENVGNIANKQMIVGAANGILLDLVKFATTLASLPAVQDSSGLINALVANVNAMMSGMIDSLREKSAQMTPVGASFGNNLANGIKSTAPNVAASGASLQGAMWDAIQARMADEYYQGRALGMKLAEGVRTGRDAAYQAGASLQGAVWDAINARIGDLWHQGRALANNLVNGMRAGSGDAYNSGVNAVAGFISGAQSKNTYTVGGWIVQNFLKGMRNAAKERSPWKTTQQSGKYAAQGLADGIKRNASLAVRAATSLANNVAGAMENSSIMNPQMSLAAYNGNMPNISSDASNYGYNSSNRNGAIINQYNTVNGEVDMGRVNRDLAWDFKKI